MRSLDEIVKRNHEAAARECAHAVNDGNHVKASAILDTYGVCGSTNPPAAFTIAYNRARKEA
jgi:hypothetical protein